MASSDSGQQTIQAVETTFVIIRQIEKQKQCRLTDLANELDMPKSTVYKHLQTLIQNEYLQVNNGDYQLSLKFLKHGGAVRDQCRIYSFGRSKVEKLSDQLDELVLLSMKENNRGVFLFRSNDQYNLKESLPLGERFYLHRNGAGKAMLAELSNESVRDLIRETGLPKATDTTITDEETLIEELNEARRNGYTINKGERDSNVRAVSAGLKDEKTGDIGAISISVPSGSPAVDHLDGEYAEAVQQAASELSLELRHN
jgi:DNA-binding IclR family transcriptional regulator